MTTRYLIIPYAQGESEPRVLLARVQMLQKRAGGRNIRGQIPDHAGQLTLFDGTVADSTAPDTAVFGLLRLYTGIDLSDPAARGDYGLSAPRFEPLKDANYTVFIAAYLETDHAGLEKLARAIQSSILTPANVNDGTYGGVEALQVSQAQLPWRPF